MMNFLGDMRRTLFFFFKGVEFCSIGKTLGWQLIDTIITQSLRNYCTGAKKNLKREKVDYTSTFFSLRILRRLMRA